MNLKLEWLPGTYAVCRFEAGAHVPEWAGRPSALMVVARTEDELSIIANEAHIDDKVKAERGFVALRVAGTLDFSMVGVIAQLADALRDARVPMLVVSTYDTDILLVRKADAEKAHGALSQVASIDPPDS